MTLALNLWLLYIIHSYEPVHIEPERVKVIYETKDTDDVPGIRK